MLPALGRSMPELGSSNDLSELAMSGTLDHIPSALWDDKPRRRTTKLPSAAKPRRSDAAQAGDPALNAKLVELVEWVRESAVDPAEEGLSSTRAVELYTRAMAELQQLMAAQSRPLAETFEILFQGYRQATQKSSAATYVNEVSRLAESEGRLAAEAETKLLSTSNKLEDAQFALRVEEQKAAALLAKVDRLEIELQGALDAKDAAGYQLPAMQKLIDNEKAAGTVLAEQFDALTAQHEETKLTLLTAQQRNLELEEKLRYNNIETGAPTNDGVDSPRTLQREAEARLAERDEDVKQLEARIKRMTLEHAREVLALQQQIDAEGGQSNLVGTRPPGSGIPGPRDNRVVDQENPDPDDEEDLAPHDPVLAASLDEFWGMSAPMEQADGNASPRSVSTMASSADGRPNTSDSMGASAAMMGMFGAFGAVESPEQPAGSRSRLSSRQGSRQGSRKGSRQGPRTTSRGSVGSRGSQRAISSPTAASKVKRGRAAAAAAAAVELNPVQQETVNKVKKQLKRAQAEVKRLANEKAQQTVNLNAERKRRKELSQAKAILEEKMLALEDQTAIKMEELDKQEEKMKARMEEIETERTTLRTKAAKTVHRLKQQNEQQTNQIETMAARDAHIQKSIGSIMMHVNTTRSDMSFVLATSGSAAPWRGQWRKMLVDSSATDSGISPMDMTNLLKTCADIVGDRLHMQRNYQATATKDGHPEGWACEWEPQLAECAYDFFIAKFNGDVSAAERELMNFVLGLRMHYVKHSRLRLFGLLTGVLQDVSTDGVRADGEGVGDVMSSRHAADFYLGACATLQRQLHPVDGRQMYTTPQIEKFQAIFDSFDPDGSGSLDTEELASLLKVLKLELSDAEIVDMAKAVDDDGSGDMGFNEFLEVIMIVNEMKKLGCPRAEVMLPGNPDSEFFMWERSGEGRHVGKEMADVTVRKLFQGLPPDRLSEVMKRVKEAAYGGLLATTVDPDILLDALMVSWKTEVELAQLTVEKRLSTIFTDAVKAQSKVLADDNSSSKEHHGPAADDVPEPELEPEPESAPGAHPDAVATEEERLPDLIKMRLAYTRMVAANRDGTLGVYRGCTPRILSVAFADGVRRWVEAQQSPDKQPTSGQGADGEGAGELLKGVILEEIPLGLASTVAKGLPSSAPPVELAQAISEAMVCAGLVAVPPTDLNIFPSQEKIAASASKGRKLKRFHL